MSPQESYLYVVGQRGEVIWASADNGCVLDAGVPQVRHGKRLCFHAWKAKAVNPTLQRHLDRMRTSAAALTWLMFTLSPSSSFAHSW